MTYKTAYWNNETQQQEERDCTPEEVAEIVSRQTQTKEQLEAKEASRIDALWQAAYNYEFAQISGVAIAVLVIGVLQGLPKSLAIKGWSQSIWTLYYARKATDSTDTDYSSVGACPYSIPELLVEVGV